MAYTYQDAVKTIYKYLNLDSSKVIKLANTNGRGIEYEFDGIKTVIFIYPISCKQGNKQNFFDTRDSGAKERAVTWEYAKSNNYRYFCFGVNEEQDRYKDYVLSLESDENSISNISFRLSQTTGATGTQVNIPNDFIPTQKFERRKTPKGFFIAAIHKDYIRDYIRCFDNRPYLNADLQTDAGDIDIEREVLPFDKSKECARLLIDAIYKVDKFKRLSSYFKNNVKNLKIITDDLGGNYLTSVFAKENTEIFEKESGDKIRVFTDCEYLIPVEGKIEKCRLSTEWVSSELGKQGESANYLRALINIINKRYSDVLKVYEDEESGVWYLEYLQNEFKAENLPECFNNNFARRYINSLLAKPFVILTGNSGTGKTRIAKQFAEYLEVEDENGDKNWLIVPVGADWTDNAKILGFYNPLAENGTGSYEKTGILKLIEAANENPDKPYFIILDEMNLSHVERYFSDFLSHMETPDSPFKMDGYAEGELKYPDNLFIVGTVNIDETTYMFSPKVLDRANVVEFKPDKEDVLALFGAPVFGSKVTPANDGTAEAFLRLAKEIRIGKCEIENADAEAMDKIRKIFDSVYDAVEKKDFEFAFRTVREIRQYIAAAYEISGKDESFNLSQAIDEQILQKIMPKIHGNRKEIGELLDKLEKICNDNGFTLSGKKIKQMKGKLDSVQYASFI